MILAGNIKVELGFLVIRGESSAVYIAFGIPLLPLMASAGIENFFIHFYSEALGG